MPDPNQKSRLLMTEAVVLVLVLVYLKQEYLSHFLSNFLYENNLKHKNSPLMAAKYALSSLWSLEPSAWK